MVIRLDGEVTVAHIVTRYQRRGPHLLFSLLWLQGREPIVGIARGRTYSNDGRRDPRCELSLCEIKLGVFGQPVGSDHRADLLRRVRHPRNHPPTELGDASRTRLFTRAALLKRSPVRTLPNNNSIRGRSKVRKLAQTRGVYAGLTRR